jgi:hypothetical protein
LVEHQVPFEGRVDAGHRRGSDRALAQVARQSGKTENANMTEVGQKPAGGTWCPKVAGDVLAFGFGEGSAAGWKASGMLMVSPRDGSTKEPTHEWIREICAEEDR